MTRNLEKIRRRLPLDWLLCSTDNPLVLHPMLVKLIERFWTQAMPRLT